MCARHRLWSRLSRSGLWTGPGLALLEAARPTLATALRQILTRGSRGNPCRTDSRLTVLWAGEWRVSDSAPDCWTVARASLSLAGDWQAGLCWGHVCTGPPGWLPCPGPSQLTPTAVGGWRGRDRETAGCGCPPPLCSGRFFPVFTPGTCLWGGLRACRCQGQGAVWCLERLGSSPGHVSSACPRALLTAGTFHVPGAGRPSRVRACSRTAYMGRAAVFMGPGKVCGCLAPGVSGGPGATSCSDLESTFEASGTQRVGQCPQRWRQVAPGGSGRARRGGGQWHPEGRAVPAEVEASGTRRVGQCPQRWRPVGTRESGSAHRGGCPPALSQCAFLPSPPAPPGCSEWGPSGPAAARITRPACGPRGAAVGLAYPAVQQAPRTSWAPCSLQGGSVFTIWSHSRGRPRALALEGL